MAYPESFMNELHMRISLSDEVAKKVRLVKKGGQYWGCCPFHKEKTASFSVSDDKGFYHCFGCGAHGDIISFVMQTENLSFPEAVEKLADVAGLQVPVSSFVDKHKEAKRASLYEVLELACSFFQKNLSLKQGQEALAYLKGRGVPDDIIASFRLGYAGAGKSLRSFLLEKGVSESQLTESGLFKDKDGIIYEYFKNRVMFPISDKRGRIVAFGGRVLDDAEPKYLNSPETELFKKGEMLFSYARALPFAREQKQVILTEGYMDVIALNMFGFKNVVAPLGTAFTEIQAKLLWKMVDEPLICFDGDTAGLKAAERAALRILPILAEGKSVNFVFLPDKMDPDEILKRKGKEFFLSLLANPVSLSDFMWEYLTKGKKLDTPERKALLEKNIDDLIGQISSSKVKLNYHQFFKNKVWNSFKQKKNKSQKQSLNTNEKAQITSLQAGELEAKMMLAYLICYPESMSKWIEELLALSYPDILKDTAESIIDFITSNPEATKDIILQALPSGSVAMLKEEIEMLSREIKMPREIDENMHEYLSIIQLKKINEEIKQISSVLAQNLDNPSEALWKKYNNLQEEKQHILQLLYQ